MPLDQSRPGLSPKLIYGPACPFLYAFDVPPATIQGTSCFITEKQVNKQVNKERNKKDIFLLPYFCDAVRSLHFKSLLVIANPPFVVPLQYSHLAWIQTDRKSGGLGDLNYPLVADLTKEISKAYNVLIGDVVRLVLGCHGLARAKALSRGAGSEPFVGRGTHLVKWKFFERFLYTGQIFLRRTRHLSSGSVNLVNA